MTVERALPEDLAEWSQPFVSFLQHLHDEITSQRPPGRPPIRLQFTFAGDYNVHVAPSDAGYQISFDVGVIATTYCVTRALIATTPGIFDAREIEQGIPRAIPTARPLLSSAATLTPVTMIVPTGAHNLHIPERDTLLTTALTCLALQFIYSHEFFHVGLGHVRFLARRSDRSAYIFAEMHGREVAPQLRKVRSAFEVQADAMAGCLLFAEALAASASAVRTGAPSAHWTARSFAVASVIATMHALLRASGADPQIATVLRADAFIHPAPAKRRFFMEPFMCMISEDSRVQASIRKSFNDGIQAEGTAWSAAKLLAFSDPESWIKQFESIMKSRPGDIMRDPMEWIDEVNATLESVADELRHGD